MIYILGKRALAASAGSLNNRAMKQSLHELSVEYKHFFLNNLDMLLSLAIAR